MHILIYERKEAYTQTDLIFALKNAGIRISTFTYTFENKSHDDNFTLYFLKLLSENSYDAVFSINYYPLIAECCYKKNMKYISWSYDCPLNVRNIEETLSYPTNYVFLFDRIQALKYINKGFDHIYHLPLAVNTSRLDQMIPLSSHYHKYGSDISFVGSLYESTYQRLIQPLPDYLKGYLDSMCDTQLLLYGCFFLDDTITQGLINLINEFYDHANPQKNFHIIKEELSYSMATQVTNYERIRLLKLLSTIPDCTINLFSPHNLADTSLTFKGPIDYMSEMPYVFKTSKINLNITLKCIQSGIPLRALDIMGCGGFLLSNYQAEMTEFFRPGIDFVSYGSMDEAKDLAKYYLSHEEERKTIAQNGYEIVKQHFTYEKQLKQIFDIVNI